MQDEGYHIGTIHLKGWKAIVGIIVIICIIFGCIVNIRETPTDDQELISTIKSYIRTIHFGKISNTLQKHLDSGDMQKAASEGSKIESTRINIESIKLAYPIINHFLKKKDVIAKVTYNISVNSAAGKSKTEYFELEYIRITDSWLCYRKAVKLEYYINLSDDD